jgi:hypothetical protein
MTAVAAFAIIGLLAALGMPGRRPAAVTATGAVAQDERAQL